MIRVTAISEDMDGNKVSVSAEVPGALDEQHMQALAKLLVDSLYQQDDGDDDGGGLKLTPQPVMPVNRN